MNIRIEMEKRLSNEKTFDKIEDALEYAITLERTNDEDVMILKKTSGKFCTVHLMNAEIAVQLGYTLIYGFDEISYAAKSNKNPKEAIDELHNLVNKRIHNKD